MNGWSTSQNYYVSSKNSGPFCEDAQDKGDWSLGIKKMWLTFIIAIKMLYVFL